MILKVIRDDQRLEDMCNLSEGIVQRAFRDTTIRYVIDAMRSYKVSADKALADFNIPKDERPFYKEWVEEKLKDDKIVLNDQGKIIVDETQLRTIKKIMIKLNYNCDQAMDFLEVPESERPLYKQWIENNSGKDPQ